LRFAICVSVPLRSLAQEPVDENLSMFLSAVPIAKAAPNYPSEALANRREGWVALSFMISPAGQVTEPMIEDSSGVESLENAALDAVKKWRYKPATFNGQPVEDTVTRTVVRFRLDGESGMSGTFRASYMRIQDSVKNGNLPQAAALLDELEHKERLNLYEDAWFWWLKYTYLDAAGGSSPEEQSETLSAAIGYDDFLPPDALVMGSLRLYNLRVRQADYARAFGTLDRLKGSRRAQDSTQYAEVVKAMDANAQQIKALIDGNTTLKVNAAIGQHDYWVHGLLRRSFSIAEIRGRIEAVEIRCSRRNARYDLLTAEHTWTIAKSWGDCGAYVKGDPGTTFVVYEHPNGE